MYNAPWEGSWWVDRPAQPFSGLTFCRASTGCQGCLTQHLHYLWGYIEMLFLITSQICIQKTPTVGWETSEQHTTGAGSARRTMGAVSGAQANWVVTQLLIDHVYLTNLESHITDKWVWTNLQHLKRHRFLGNFFGQTQSLLAVIAHPQPIGP